MTTGITLELVGKTPLLCHNVEIANPMSPQAKAMAEITGKRKKTDADRIQLARLEWFAGLYTAPGITGPAFPTRAIRKSLIEGARLTKRGKDVERAVSFDSLYVPIAYTGPRNLEELYESGCYVDSSMVVVGTQRVLRTRPMFSPWALVADLWIEEDLLNPSALQQVADAGGRSIGVGDNRTNGFGRYTATVKVSEVLAA